MGNIGNICREWRKSHGITQAFIGRIAGVSRAHVCNFEKGGVDSNRLLSVYLQLGLDIGLDEVIDYLAGHDGVVLPKQRKRGGATRGKEKEGSELWSRQDGEGDHKRSQ